MMMADPAVDAVEFSVDDRLRQHKADLKCSRNLAVVRHRAHKHKRKYEITVIGLYVVLLCIDLVDGTSDLSAITKMDLKVHLVFM